MPETKLVLEALVLEKRNCKRNMNLFVGNLSYEATAEDLEQLFTPFGSVVSAKVITDKYSGRSKGFGFVEFESKDSAEAAINELNGSDYKGRAMVVNEARPKRDEINY